VRSSSITTRPEIPPDEARSEHRFWREERDAHRRGLEQLRRLEARERANGNDDEAAYFRGLIADYQRRLRLVTKNTWAMQAQLGRPLLPRREPRTTRAREHRPRSRSRARSPGGDDPDEPDDIARVAAGVAA
jgi:hypothetical protein